MVVGTCVADITLAELGGLEAQGVVGVADCLCTLVLREFVQQVRCFLISVQDLCF